MPPEILRTEDEEPKEADMAFDAAIYQNSFVEFDHSFRSTGFRSSSQRFEAGFRPDSEPNVSEWFLCNTRLCRGDRETEHSIASYFTDVSSLMLSMLGRRRSSAAQVPLGKHVPIRMMLSEAIARRRTVRGFTGDAIDFAHLSTILVAGNGITTKAKVDLATGETVNYRYRATASAGGLYPIEAIVAVCNVRGLKRGIYRHDPLTHTLEQMMNADAVPKLLDTICLPENVVSLSRAGAVVLLVGHPWRSMRKYGPRGMRFVFIEAGGIAQNYALASSALGYACVPCASIYDDEVHNLLGIDGVTAALAHSVILGCPG
ncbi:SagB/ThcOx family dehydrogenase [Tunturiibacter gelidoferens]|uniref:SagB-type dehydrogenase family enzyme n=1 Tax=Tunturiibacter gelidiferens TaxID=3069689 RepID=A0ACC5P575_9BACT|nr:SagB/ThcOx family dehydrogenase [Edaphobacter lichenicola]MBB5342008.1 SagB-type dehydrogenase family enzyme [Edaphobacter lichenicola]